MVETQGLTHISLAVHDPQKSADFYAQVFGVREYYRDAEQIQVQGPGPFDVLAFERQPDHAGRRGGITHFGFRLDIEADSDAMNCGKRHSTRSFVSPGSVDVSPRTAAIRETRPPPRDTAATPAATPQ
ncbi:VOC family protein [Pseudomonas cavernae]